MAEAKKPDAVVYNTETQRYDAYLKPYGTHVGAPAINTTDTVAWKNRSVTKLNHTLKTRFEAIKDQYEQLMQVYEDNKLIHDAVFSFEPIVGQHYHLYAREDGETFLSIIAPHECHFNALGSFYLNADHIWERIV